MLYLIEHDKNDNPKTRWGQFNNCTIADVIQTLTTFCSCIDYIDNLYIHDSNGQFTLLSKVCDTYNIPYRLKEDKTMNTLCIIKPSKELLLEIKRYYPISYRYDDWESVYLVGNIIMEDPFRGTFTIILQGRYTKVQLTVSPDQCNKVYVSNKKWR